jgi:hypothetical protein
MKGEKLHMRINLLSSFAAGILITTSICGTVYFTDKSDVSKASVKQIKVQPSENEMKDKLAAAGYVVETKAEYDKNIKDAKVAAPKGTPTPANNQPNKIVTRVVVSVTDGMTSINIGRILENAKIIPNAFRFSKDVEKKGVEKNLRPGTFVVDTQMTYDQVIATIFKK